MAPRPDVSETRKEQIIQAAINVFNRLGFHNARMDDIVKESGLSKGAIYWYFKSKEDLIIAILDRIFGAEFKQIEALNDPAVPASTCLVNFMEFFITDIHRVQHLMPIVYEFYALAFRNKLVRTVMQRYLFAFVNLVEPIIQRGMDAGEFVKGDARQISLALAAQIEGSMLLEAYAPNLLSLEDQLRGGTRLLLQSLKTVQ